MAVFAVPRCFRLHDMLPSVAIINSRGRSGCDGKSAHDGLKRCPLLMHGSNCANILFPQFCHSVFRSNGLSNVAINPTPSRIHVRDVLFLSPGPQMARIYATPIVTGMQGVERTIFSNLEEKRNVMGIVRGVSSPKQSISRTTSSANPKPAMTKSFIVGVNRPILRNLGPETGYIVFSQVHKKTVRPARAHTVSSAEAENGKSLCVSGQTNSAKVSETPINTTQK
jgi:hypothetical protein